MMRQAAKNVRIASVALLGGVLIALVLGAAPASASSAWWLLNSSSAPTKIAPGAKNVQLLVTAVDEGYSEVTGASKKVVFTDKVPAGLKITSVVANAGPYAPFSSHKPIILSCTQEGQTVTCPMEAAIQPAENLRMTIEGELEGSVAAGASLSNEVHIEGGTTKTGSTPPPASLNQPLTISPEPVKFGAEQYELRAENADGTVDSQAGSHPFQLTTTFNLNKTLELHELFGKLKESPFTAALPKNLHFVLPPGLIGNVAKLPQCSGADFSSINNGKSNYCPADTAIGYATVTLNEPATVGTFTQEVPLFNLAPSLGEPARFGFVAHTVPVILTTKVRSGSDYAVEVSVELATEAAEILNSQVTVWGVPGDTRHDEQRGWECLGAGYLVAEEGKPCVPQGQSNPQAVLTLPTSCEGVPSSTVSGVAWNGEELGANYTFPASLFGCGSLPFAPSIEVQTDSQSAATPSGMTVKIKVPQETTLSSEEGARAESAIRDTTLALPVGIQASGGAANGLATCTGEQFGFNGFESGLAESSQTQNNHFNTAAVQCPDAAKIGTVSVVTPLLEHELKGDVYLAKEGTNPFLPAGDERLVLYIFAEDPISGVQVKLAGEIKVDPNTGQLTSVFKETPPVPFSELALHLFDGPRASQSTPELCGSYSASASFDGWSGTTAPASSAPFSITSGVGGTPCAAPGTQPFAPSFLAGSASPQAGALSPFTVTIGRPDGHQALKTITVHEPLGAAAMLSSVTPCPIAQATAAVPSCPASSLIGKSTAIAGLGSTPVEIPGEVFLTGPYRGAPFGLLAVTNAEKVGPFNLGKIPVMSKITVDETTAQASITSDPLPQFVKGVPSQIKQLNVTVDREGFTFNPTNCGSLEVSGTLTGYGPGGSEGTENVSTPYHAANCASLPFKPTVTVSTEANFSRVDGLGMKIIVTSGKGQANIKKTKLVFPSSLPSRLTTIQKACPAAVFNANPASCPEGSVIGTGIAHTPVLKTPLTGPAYLVSHGGAAFPDAEFVLQSEGIKLVLDGKTNISKGITSSTFAAVPDAPVETFEVTLPRGPHSAFSGFGNLCSKPLNMPTEFGGQNGALIEETTRISVKNCSGVLPSKTESKLAKALKACKKVKGKKKRASCEAKAHKKYGAKKKSKKAVKKTAKHH
jgi:hypothetical protein